MKNQLFRIAALPVAAALLSLAPEAFAAGRSEQSNEPMRFMHRVDESKLPFGYAETQGRMKAPQATTLPATDNYKFLEGPDGSIWSACTEFTYNEEVLPGGVATDKYITGFKITVYNSLFEEVGSIKDVITLAEGETRMRQVMPDMTVTKKFFNADNNYEIIVSFAANTTQGVNNYYSKIYSIGGQKDDDGNDVAIQQIPGYVVDSKNYSTKSYDEQFLITFIEEFTPDINDYTEDQRLEYLADHKLILKTYRKGGWDPGAQLVETHEMPLVCFPGDTTQALYFMLTSTPDGKPAIIYNQYEKSYYVDPSGFGESAGVTPDNNLVIEVKTMASATASATQTLSTTKIPLEAPNENLLGKYYSIGALCYKDDVKFIDGKPTFIVAVEDMVAGDMDNLVSSYYIYDSEGNRTATIFEGATGFVVLSDIAGEAPLVLFPQPFNGSYVFHFVNVLNGEEELTLPMELQGNLLSAVVDRVALKGNIYYVFSLGNLRTDANGNVIERVAWVTTEGEVERVDEINLGKGVLMAKCNIASEALTPYLFDTDDDMEYMYLVKRSAGDIVNEEFVVVDNNGEYLLEVGPDDVNGVLAGISLANSDSTPKMVVTRYGDKYNVDVYDLPFTKFVGGKGTQEDPYLIATVADLQQIDTDINGYYRVVADFDANGYAFRPVASFGGTIEGDNHIISNFSTTGAYSQGMVSSAKNMTVKNLTFVAPSAALSSANNEVGVIAGTAYGLTAENIHVYGLEVSSDEAAPFKGTFGGIVGNATNNSRFADCFVSGNVNLPEAANAGGIVGETRTGSKVVSSAFVGALGGGTNVGGIIGTAGTDSGVADCHVDADITAKNTVGGIVGSTSRVDITRCYVEGTVKATEPSRWKGACAGGIAGELAPLPGEYNDKGEEVPTEAVPVIFGNMVALTSIEGVAPTTEPAFPSRFDTVHRIVGWTSENDAEVIDYDAEYNEIYGDPKPELGLKNNYAISTLAVVNAGKEAEHTTTEGASVEKTDRKFFEDLGFAYGKTTDSPWNEMTDADPSLHFEQAFYINPADIRVVEGEKFFVTMNIISRLPLEADAVASDLTCDFDEAVIAMTGFSSFLNNVLSLEFEALKEGNTTVAVSLLGSNASAAVTVEAVSGIEAPSVVETAAPAIAFNGAVVSAEGCSLSIYSLAGACVARGNDAVAVDAIAPGVYIAVAVNADGAKATRKIAL